MAAYEFRCRVHGTGTANYPIGTAPPQIACATCGEPAARVFSPPRLSFTSPRSRAISGAIEHAEKTAERPDVVTALPPKPGRAAPPPLRPGWRNLPRP